MSEVTPTDEMIQNLAKSIVQEFIQELKQQGGDNE
jgi:hypothetical protein